MFEFPDPDSTGRRSVLRVEPPTLLSDLCVDCPVVASEVVSPGRHTVLYLSSACNVAHTCLNFRHHGHKVLQTEALLANPWCFLQYHLHSHVEGCQEMVPLEGPRYAHGICPI